MQYGLVIEKDGGIGLIWCRTLKDAQERLVEEKAANPNASSSRYTIVEVLWSIQD